MTRDKEIREQSLFCKELAVRLDKQIADTKHGLIYDSAGFDRYTQLQADIVRIRRELLTLAKMIAPQC